MNSRQRDVALAGAALLFIAAFWKLRLFDPATAVTVASYDAFAQIYPMWQRAGEWMTDGPRPPVALGPGAHPPRRDRRFDLPAAARGWGRVERLVRRPPPPSARPISTIGSP